MKLTSKQEPQMANDKNYFDKVNGHTVVKLTNKYDNEVCVCIDCKIRGPYSEAFEDISCCSN